MRNKDIIFVAAGGGEQVNVLGSTHTNKSTPADTRGAFAALEIVVPPRCGPPMHRHRSDAECFYILEGEITFESPAGAVTARMGDFCCLPAGGRHSFRNDGAAPARAFVVISPGAEAYRFFHEVGERLNGAIDFDVVADVASRNSIEFVG